MSLLLLPAADPNRKLPPEHIDIRHKQCRGSEKGGGQRHRVAQSGGTDRDGEGGGGGGGDSVEGPHNMTQGIGPNWHCHQPQWIQGGPGHKEALWHMQVLLPVLNSM